MVLLIIQGSHSDYSIFSKGLYLLSSPWSFCYQYFSIISHLSSVIQLPESPHFCLITVIRATRMTNINTVYSFHLTPSKRTVRMSLCEFLTVGSSTGVIVCVLHFLFTLILKFTLHSKTIGDKLHFLYFLKILIKHIWHFSLHCGVINAITK